ncbi:MAG: M48 family metalloprotease [Candidatus Krumholzibacteriota bacterium]|nr:M48 family metalloprotease [Candidatus Krumholzibacteriota bacterium]
MSAAAGMLAGFWLAVLEHLWQSTLVLVALLALGRTLRRAPARVADLLWSAALAKLFLPLAMLGGLAGRLLPAPAAVPGAEPALGAAAGLLTAPHAVDFAASPSLAALLLAAATLAWAACVLGRLAVLVRELRGIARVAGLPAASLQASRRRRLAAVLARTGIPVGCLHVSSEALMPAVTGLLRPRILLPLRLLDALSDRALAAVLLHEDAHRRRRDPLRAVLARVAAAVFCFHPLMGLLIRRLRESAELAADEAALDAGVEAGEYGRAIARTVGLGLAPHALAVGAGDAERSLLERRLARLRTGRCRLAPGHRLAAVAGLALVALASLLPLPAATRAVLSPGPGGAGALARLDRLWDPAPSEPGESGEAERFVRPAPVRASYALVRAEWVDVPPAPVAARLPAPPAPGTPAVDVEVKGIIERDGRFVPGRAWARGIAGSEDFLRAAERAAASWRFVPARRNGRAVPVKCRIVFTHDPDAATPAPDPFSLRPPSDAAAPRAAGA